MNAWKVILATLVIFVAGVVTGGLVATNAMRVKQSHPKSSGISTAAPNATPWQARNKELLRRMDRELDLSPDQHQHIETIMASGQERTKALWKPITPQMNREMLMVRSQIREELNPDQQKKFDTFLKTHPPLDKHHTNSLPAGQFNALPTSPVSNEAAPVAP